MQNKKSGWKNRIKELTEIKCPKCKSKHVYRFGSKMTTNGKAQRYQCQKCGYVWIDENE